MTLARIQDEMSAYLTGARNDVAALLSANSVSRLSVYSNNYRMGLVTSLRDSYEQLWSWLGDELFDAACTAHIEAHPPHDWTLNSYGRDFGDTLARLYPDDGEVGEIAALDWAMRSIFDGPDDPPIMPDEMGVIDWDSAVLRPVATLQLLLMTTNAASIWNALQAQEMPEGAALLEAPQWVRVWREELSPQFRVIDDVEAEALRFIAPGASFVALCESLAEHHDEASAAAIAGTFLSHWVQDGVITLAS